MRASNEVNRIEADEPLEVPAVYLSSVFRKDDLKAGGTAGKQYRYLSVVQGRCGWKAKLVVSYTYDELSRSVFHEALNGYSTVVAGAVTDAGHESVLGNSIVQQISDFTGIGRLRPGTLGIVS